MPIKLTPERAQAIREWQTSIIDVANRIGQHTNMCLNSEGNVTDSFLLGFTQTAIVDVLQQLNLTPTQLHKLKELTRWNDDIK